MQLSKMDGRRRVVLSLSLALVASVSLTARADEELPPPPEGTMDSASSGADLPPPPGSDLPPDLSAESELPPSLDEVSPPIPEEELAAPSEPPIDSMTPEAPPVMVQSPETRQFSTRAEFAELSVEDKLKSKDLVLWLTLGPNYGSVETKGDYISPSNQPTGGIGYAANIGFMMGSLLQAQMDFTGTPLTDNSTVSNIMFGVGPRIGFLSAMFMFGVQDGPKLSVPGNNPPQGALSAYGFKGSLDLVLGHKDHSRVSYGIAPEAFYVTTQGKNGFKNMGMSVSFRIYGYENAF